MIQQMKCVALREWQYFVNVFCLVMASGCSDADYPMITYPPDSPRFQNPAVRIEIPSISLIEKRQVSISEVSIPKPSAEIVVHGTLSHDEDDENLSHVSLAVMFLGTDENPVCLGLCFPERGSDGKLAYEIHLLGPDLAGPYEFVLRGLTSPSTENFELLRVPVSVAAFNN